MSIPVIIPGAMTRKESVCDIIESIAMEELSNAYIPIAECKKLKAIIKTP